MIKKIISILICLLLITTAVVLAEAKISVLSKEHLMKSNEPLGANLTINPTSHDFGNMTIGDIRYTTFEIWDSGCCYLVYSLTENCTWVDITPTAGSSIGEHDTITVNIDTAFLDTGFHQCDIQITSNGGNLVFHVYVNCSRADTPRIALNPHSYNLGDVIKGTNPSTNFEIWNCGIGTLSYSFVEIPDWILVHPTNGTSIGEHDIIIVNITTSKLFSGLHSVDLHINSTGGDGAFHFSINIKNPIPELSYSPHSYNFGYKLKGETDLTNFEIWNSGEHPLTYSIIENCSWVTVSPTSGTSTGEHNIITVKIDTTGLTQHSNSYDIYIDSNGGVGYFTVTVLIGDMYTNITVQQAWTLLTNNSNGIQTPIDVRYDNEWAQAHIDTPAPENPRHYCLCMWSNETFLKEFMDLYQEKEIILYCKAGSRSLTAANLLVENNFTGIIYNMLGGIDAWISAGYPTKANSPPNIPVISGENKGKIGQDYQYIFNTTDIDQDNVYYYVNWSDNTSNQLIGPYHSGEEATLSHTWSEKGKYTVKVKARDIYGAESDYATLEVKMPKTSTIVFHQFLLRIFEKIHLFFPFFTTL
jgi:rhodanese-related sulfurtransferase